MSQILFQNSLPHNSVRKLFTQQQNPRKSSAWSWWGRGAQKHLANKASNNSLKSSPMSPIPRSTTPVLDIKKSYAKSLRLTSDQLKSLDLKDGMNTVEFSVSSGFQGKAVCNAKIFVWNYDAKIVISDVDGTITKSDVLGHVFTMVGKDWTHEGVANYYSSIKNNGYQFLYLTSRAIGQGI
jgi:phosphatidate phosphatase LPIN